MSFLTASKHTISRPLNLKLAAVGVAVLSLYFFADQPWDKPVATRKMHIESIPMWEGSGNNYAYLVTDDKTKEAVIIDPANPKEVLPVLKKATDGGVKLKNILNTHHHHDHADGNMEMLKSYSIPIIGGCGRFFEGTAKEMDTALNKTLGALPDDTKVYPGHEYTKANVKFAVAVSQSEPIKKLEAFASSNKQTQGKFTIGDEKM
ncbi:hypothetical protein B0A54_17305 [Friedmanniomyces endolithicus]|uniref:Hydroxyacylglutathione hydrolase n=1 Tax=Friedmanniomyces endolithicus TaxID=329885 RepID=A0A4U0TTH9_9PEZI|nr:hypothetical protein B0A54_17305 [Friedmanniomyces endolithicus]